MLHRSHFLFSVFLSFAFGMFLGVAGTVVASGFLGSSIFSDVSEGSYYDEAIGELYEQGVIRGYSDGRFGPDDYVTRGQVAVLLQRFRNEFLPGNVPQARSSSRSVASSVSSSSVTSSSVSSAFSSSLNPAGTIRFTIASFSVNENANTAVISVVRTGGKTGAVAVQFALSGGTATSGTDYFALSGVLNFQDGETSRTFTVEMKDDSAAESNETVTMTLKNPTGGASLGTPATATLTIVDNETASSSSSAASAGPSFSFSADGYSVSENGGTATVTIQRLGGSSGAASVNYATGGGSAFPGSDYSPSQGTLSFVTGETSKTFTVSVSDDSVVDGNKTVDLTLSSPSAGMTLTQPSTVTLTIVDNEAGTFGSGALKFSKSTYSTAEGEGSVTITVMRTGGSDGTVSVNYATSNGSASSGSDYTATSGTLTFLDGETGKTFKVPVLEDITSEDAETVNLTLSTPTGGATIISPSTATLTIYE